MLEVMPMNDLQVDRKKITNPLRKYAQHGIHICVDLDRPIPNRPPSNPYSKFFKQEGLVLRVGRPRLDEKREASSIKSIRLPDRIWKRVEAQAKREGVSRHAALRQAVLIWLKS